MRFWDTIRKRYEPKRITDPIFGEIRYRKNWWDGSLLFSPTGTQIQILVEAQEQGPTQAQHALFAEIEQRYQSLQETITDELHKQLTNWKADYPREQVWQEFKIEAISIYKPNVEMPQWDVSYEWLTDDGFTFSVGFKDWQPNGVAIDH